MLIKFDIIYIISNKHKGENIMRSEEHIIKCKRQIEETIKEFCNQDNSDKGELLDFLNLKLGITVAKFKTIDSKSLCNQKNKELINKICDKLCQDDEILFQML
jgi:predicted house-cleaning noncanonical NTP pyrophosphatase (MazG superfamily)